MNVFAPPDPLATNPTLAVLGFKRQLIFHLHFWAFVAIAPLILVQWKQDHRLLSGLLVLFCANALLVIAFLRYRNTYFLKGRLFPLLAVVSAAYSTGINGHAGLYWAYPAATALFFLLPLREATVSNIIFISVMAAVSFTKFPEADFWRITFSLGLTCVFAMVFAWLVGKLQHELTRLATTDPLTGCLNRSQLADILNHQIQMRERYERVSSLVLIDLDFFKAINDQWGHQAGDRVLKEMALRVRKRLRESDQLFRIGGEEFMIVLPETRQKDADTLAYQLLTGIGSRPFLEDISLTASASVAEVCQGETWSVWLNRADQALYEAKSRGRNQVVNARRPAAGTVAPDPVT
ncbi:GGDEF domain-containing protein [Marinobacter sp. F4206]|uniref:GGDEF domain-containing protein n=1 Tax=Marinobacter sp. F4206 TaxID=2861777 RepID=UPI001C606C72|nr:GGDEF domain-containing protein [Marinobacter sp. F4206]MBW4934864.1 GGDEF domain-containing protein [Marinobacter sp. F4206]